MKYSISGSTFMNDGTDVINVINKYRLWKLKSSNTKSNIIKDFVFEFEAWVNSEEDKNMMFNELKQFVDTYGGSLSWHECRHDEDTNKSCVMSEVYRGL